MAKKKVKIEPAPDVPQAEAGGLGEEVLVKFIGPARAVLAGRSILHGEKRRVTRLNLQMAERNRPGEWEVVGAGKPAESMPGDEGVG